MNPHRIAKQILKSSLLCVLVLMVCVSVGYAQQRPVVRAPRWSTVSDTFVTQVTNYMRFTKAPAAIEVADQFGAAWVNLSPTMRQNVLSAAVEFDKRNYRPYPYYQAMMELVVQAAQTLSNDKPNHEALMDCLAKTATQEPAKNLLPFCDRVKFFLVNQAIYFNKFYTLRVGQAPYTFEYIGQSAAVADTIPIADPESTETQKKLDDWNSEPAPVVDDPNAATAGVDGDANQGPEVQMPPLEGAIIRFAQADLTFATGYDSTTLRGTAGAFMIVKDHWVGKGGRFSWSVTGLPDDLVYTEFKDYHFPVRFPHILAENATLHYDTKLFEPVLGAFEFKSVKHKTPAESTYPRFISYGAVSKYRDLGDDVTIIGGFSMQGTKINTSALHLGQSTLTIRHRGKEVYRGISRRFELDSTISSQGVYSILPRGLDSLTQAHARMVYERLPTPRIRLYKNTGQYREAPFFDSYFRTEITSEALFYTLDSNKIDFVNQSNKFRAPVVVESMDYFTPDRYADVQGINRFSPIGIVVANYLRNNKNPVFYADDIAEHYKLKSAQVRASMQSLANEGFISYDPITGQGEVGNKLQHYYRSVKKMKDYDYIAILSIAPEKVNASINLDSNILYVHGVDRFAISDSLEIFIKPKNRTIRIMQNRDILFDGEVQAGNFLVNGDDFNFNYKFYQIDLNKIDSMDVLGDKKAFTARKRAKEATRLTGFNRNDSTNKQSKFTKGVLFINKPENKSNRVRMSQYPILDVQAPSYVYFDKPSILGGAYNQRIYFYVPPFKVDSIAGANLAAIAFNGNFHSDNIFPEFQERLEVRQDKSMGFEHAVPAEGYQLYKGPGKFFGTVSLDKRGLRGKGTIKYLTTTIKSDDFIFYQDSVVAKGQTVVMDKGASGDSAAFPDAHVTDYTMKWKTKADTMYLTNSGKTPWYFYNKRVRLNGTVALNKTGAFGSGLIRASGSRAESPNFTFKQDRLAGRNAFFEVQSANPVKPAFASKNVKFNFFVDDEYAEFSPEVDGAPSNEFPYARYRTSIPKAVWDLKKKTVTMSTQDSSAGGTFYSTLPDQDSLNFVGRTALYDIAKARLSIGGVKHINVADGLIIPDSGKVEILENAEMTPLKNCTLILDTINKYHKLVHATITVKGRFAFEGEATYLYINTVNDTLPIRFDKFEFTREDKKQKAGADPVIHTRSGGEIDEEKPLKIAKGVLFKGTATMWANRPTLEFQGFVKLDLKKTDTEWLKYETTGESKEFVLDLKSATDADGHPVTTGIFHENGSSELYGVFVNSKRNPDDHEIFTATGVMNFNSETGDFKVGAAERLSGKTTEGNIFSYNDSTSNTTFEGKLSFLNKNQNELAINAAGIGKGQMDSADYLLNTLLELEMKLPEKAWAEMTKLIQTRAKDIGFSEAMGDKDVFAQRLTDILGKKATEAYKKAGNKPVHESVPKFAKGITFTDLGLKWNKKESAFYSPLRDTTDKYAKLGILNILTANLNAAVDGYLEIKKADGLDLVTLYIEASPDAWWFFQFDDQQRLATISGQQSYNDAISAKAKPGRAGSYYFEMVDETEKNGFLKHFRVDYLNQVVKDDEYKITRKPEEEDEPASSDEPTKEPAVGQDDNQDAEASAESTNEDAKKEITSKKKPKKDKKKKKEGNPDDPKASTETAEDDDGFGNAPVEKPVGTKTEEDSADAEDPLPPTTEKADSTQPDAVKAEPSSEKAPDAKATEVKTPDETPAAPADKPTDSPPADGTPADKPSGEEPKTDSKKDEKKESDGF